jgi:cytochrome P450
VTPPVLDRMPTPGNRRYHQAHNRLRHAVNGIITDHRAGNTDHGDVLSALMPARGPAEGGAVAELTDTEISDNVINFLIAGSDTTARTLAWSLYLVAQHSSIEERLHAEADTVLAGAPASFKHLSRLRFCGFVVTEALRLYPPAWLITRTVTSDTRLGGHDLPAGTTLVYSPYLLHRRGDLHPDPDRFDPDRWDSSHRPAPPRDAFVPFGNGARKCIGDQFALTQATITLATISARWRLEALTGPPIRATGGLLLKPKGLQMRVTARPFAPTPPEPEHDLPVSTPPPTPYEGRRTLPAETGETRTTG